LCNCENYLGPQQGLDAAVQTVVPADRTIVEVLRDAGVAVETACEQGVCGTCVTSVVEGEPDHRDSVLSEEERRGEGLMTTCCSRAKSARLVLDL
jgi:vanillate O-demethylase ferredoxin subunit